jgi:hypothetical protein
MDNNESKTSYLIKDIDRDIWRRFRGKSILNGHNSAAECLRQLIKKYSKGVIE